MSHQPRSSPRLPHSLQSTEASRARSISPEKQAKRNRARASSLDSYTSSVDDTNPEAEVTYTPPWGRIDKSFEAPPPVTAKGSASKTPKQTPKQSIASPSITKQAPCTITKIISPQEVMGQTKIRPFKGLRDGKEDPNEFLEDPEWASEQGYENKEPQAKGQTFNPPELPPFILDQIKHYKEKAKDKALKIARLQLANQIRAEVTAQLEAEYESHMAAEVDQKMNTFELKSKRSNLSLRILRDEVPEESAWKENEEAKRLEEEEHLHSLEAEIYTRQASRVEVKPGEEEKNRRGDFMQLWTTSTKGLGITGNETGRGKRPRKVQEEFRRNLIAACRSTHSDSKSDEPWCSVLGHFFPDDEDMRAAHIFPWAEGQVAMDEIVGREVEKVEELSEIRNGVMLSKYAEKRLEEGDIVLKLVVFRS